MATFHIYDENENNDGNLGKISAKDLSTMPKRTILGTLNGNVKEGKALVQVENILSKKTLISGRYVAEKVSTSVQAHTEMVTKTSTTNQVTIKSSETTIFPKNVALDTAGMGRSQISIRPENKSRVLKDKQLSLPAVSDEADNIRFENLPETVSAVLNCLPLFPSQCEPMSEADDSVISPDSMDISMTSLKNYAPHAPQPSLAFRDIYICEEYRTDISIYLRTLQQQHRPRKNYMAKQMDISQSMRAILVDWLVEVTEEYNMTNETLFLAVNYIDRFLSQMSCVRSKLQLVGTAAMFIAAKYEEIYPPDVKDFVYITDDTYTKSQVLRMEHLILRVLHFDVSVPTTLWFLGDFTSHHRVSDTVKFLAMYLCELSLLEAEPYLGFLPSEIAVSAICVARYTVYYPTEEIFPSDLQKVADCHLVDLLPVVAALDRTYRNADSSVQQAIRDKYKTDKYHGVSMMSPLNEDCSLVIAREYNIKVI